MTNNPSTPAQKAKLPKLEITKEDSSTALSRESDDREPAIAEITWLKVIACRERQLLAAQQRIAELEKQLAEARRAALMEAASCVGTLAERPYDNEPEFSAILTAESAIHALAQPAKGQ